MQLKVKTYETQNSTYHIVKISKTSYEQQEEHKAELLYMTLQKALGMILTVVSIVMLVYSITPAIFPLIVGIAVTLTKDHVICI